VSVAVCPAQIVALFTDTFMGGAMERFATAVSEHPAELVTTTVNEAAAVATGLIVAVVSPVFQE
jgi:hypothetical protein